MTRAKCGEAGYAFGERVGFAAAAAGEDGPPRSGDPPPDAEVAWSHPVRNAATQASARAVRKEGCEVMVA
jgi:hypothetical protein